MREGVSFEKETPSRALPKKTDTGFFLLFFCECFPSAAYGMVFFEIFAERLKQYQGQNVWMKILINKLCYTGIQVDENTIEKSRVTFLEGFPQKNKKARNHSFLAFYLPRRPER